MNDYAKYRRENMKLDMEHDEWKPADWMEDAFALVLALAFCVGAWYALAGVLHVLRRIFA